MDDVIESEVAVVGGGPTGLAAALALGREGFETVLIAPSGAPDDGRTAALLQGSVEFLRGLGVWDALQPHTEALRTMEIVDDTGRLVRAPTVRFEAAEIGLDAFGYNSPNAAIVSVLGEAVRAQPNVRWVEEAATGAQITNDRVVMRTEHAVVRTAIAAAADGQRSILRTAAGIEADAWAYPQTALVLNLEHSRPHHGVSTELHRRSGPFTLVPLHEDRSSLVYVETPEEVARLAGLEDEMLAGEVERRSHGIRGRMTIASRRWTYPLRGLLARRLARGPVVLVGEAAHAFPPIAAQGLNLGLRDVASLAGSLTAARAGGRDLLTALEEHDRRHRVDVFSRTLGVHLLNRSLLGSLLPLQLGRAAGLSVLRSVGPLRRRLMREGVSPGQPLRAGPS